MPNPSSPSTADREIIITRLIDAPRELAWKVWTEPAHVGNWWGPNGFTNTIKEMDVRAGGKWLYIMHGPDGTDYPNEVNYIEVVKPERLVYLHGSGVANDPDTFHVTITFEKQDSKTQVTLHAVFQSAAILKKHVEEYGAIEGGKQTLARLAEYLTQLPGKDDQSMNPESNATTETPVPDEAQTIVTTRLINAPRAKVFNAWSDPEHLAKWWGPSGFTNTFHEFDFQPAGTWKFTMHGPDGTDYYNESMFLEIKEPELIIFDHLRPMHKFRVTAVLEDVNGKTKVEFRMRFESAEECERVKVYVVPANEQNFDRLEAELATM